METYHHDHDKAAQAKQLPRNAFDIRESDLLGIEPDLSAIDKQAKISVAVVLLGAVSALAFAYARRNGVSRNHRP